MLSLYIKLELSFLIDFLRSLVGHSIGDNVTKIVCRPLAFFLDQGLKSNLFDVLVANDIDVFIRWFLTGMTRSFLSQMQNGLNFDIQLFEVKSIFLKRHFVHRWKNW